MGAHPFFFRQLTLLALLCACHKAGPPPEPVPVAPAPVKSAGPDWDRVAYALELVRDEYGEEIEDGNTARVPALLQALDEARAVLGKGGADPLGMRASLTEVRGLVSKVGPPRVVAVKCVALLTALDAAEKLDRAPTTLPDLKKGAASYQSLCAACHGALKDGARSLPKITESMDPKPSIPNEVQRTPAEAFHRLTYGGAGTAMPAFGPTVDEVTRWNLAFYLFADRWPACAKKIAPLTARELAGTSDHELWKRFGFGAAACLRRSFTL